MVEALRLETIADIFAFFFFGGGALCLTTFYFGVSLIYREVGPMSSHGRCRGQVLSFSLRQERYKCLEQYGWIPPPRHFDILKLLKDEGLILIHSRWWWQRPHPQLQEWCPVNDAGGASYSGCWSHIGPCLGTKLSPLWFLNPQNSFDWDQSQIYVSATTNILTGIT